MDFVAYSFTNTTGVSAFVRLNFRVSWKQLLTYKLSKSGKENTRHDVIMNVANSAACEHYQVQKELSVLKGDSV